MAEVRSKDDFYRLYKAAVQSQDAEGLLLTDFSEGSINDMLASAASLLASELESTIVREFNKTFISNTVDEEKDELIVDHYGSGFQRLPAQQSIGTVLFSRPNADAGTVVIPQGALLSTDPDANGEVQEFETTAAVSLVGTSIYASVRAVEAGSAGNVDIGEIVNIDDSGVTTADPSITVTNETATSGGAERQTDSEYQAYVGELLVSTRAGSSPAIAAALGKITGIEQVTIHEKFQQVKNWNPVSGLPEGSPYTIVLVTAYIADANGTANPALIQTAEDALVDVRACGVNIEVVAASAQTLDWTASITLNISGPNYTELSTDTSRILATMREYIEGLGIGADFIRTTARTYIMDRWGPSGTDDLSDFTSSSPSGDVSTGTNIKLIPGTITID